jgi:hypothetical protein
MNWMDGEQMGFEYRFVAMGNRYHHCYVPTVLSLLRVSVA